MIDRIIENENRLDKISFNIKQLEMDLQALKINKKDIYLLNKYYGSKNWFRDKDAYENGLIHNVKAGVLSEDAVWNLNEELRELIDEMKKIIKLFSK